MNIPEAIRTSTFPAVQTAIANCPIDAVYPAILAPCGAALIRTYPAWRLLIESDAPEIQDHFLYPTHIENGKKSINVLCIKTGDYISRSSTTLRTNECPACKAKGHIVDNTKITKLINFYRDNYPESEYDFSKTVYVTSKNPVTIKCVTHNVTIVSTPSNITAFNGTGARCAQCYTAYLRRTRAGARVGAAAAAEPLPEPVTKIMLKEWYLREIRKRQEGYIPITELLPNMQSAKYKQCIMCDEYHLRTMFPFGKGGETTHRLNTCGNCMEIIQVCNQRASALHPVDGFKHCSGCNKRHPLDCFEGTNRSCHLRQDNDKVQHIRHMQEILRMPSDELERYRIQQRTYSRMYHVRQMTTNLAAYRERIRIKHIRYFYKNPEKKWETFLMSVILRNIQIDPNFTFEYACRLYNSPCTYCGYKGTEELNSIDRLDSSGPYSIQNTVAACVACNINKGSLDAMTYVIRCYNIICLNSNQVEGLNLQPTENYKTYWPVYGGNSFGYVRDYAVQRGIEFNISLPYFNRTVAHECLHCLRTPDEVPIGIYRANYNNGYVQNNCIPMCSECNYMRRNVRNLNDVRVIYRNIADRFVSDTIFTAEQKEFIETIPQSLYVSPFVHHRATRSAAASAAAAAPESDEDNDESFEDIYMDNMVIAHSQLHQNGVTDISSYDNAIDEMIADDRSQNEVDDSLEMELKVDDDI